MIRHNSQFSATNAAILLSESKELEYLLSTIGSGKKLGQLVVWSSKFDVGHGTFDG